MKENKLAFKSINKFFERDSYIYRLVIRLIRFMSILKCVSHNKTKYLPVYGTFRIKFPEYHFSIKLNSNGNDGIARDLFWNGFQGFEYTTIDVYLKLSVDAKVIFDIGANNGIYSLIASEYNSESQIFTFEPVPRIFKQLNKNIILNKSKNITPIQMAVSNKTGKQTLFVPRSDFPTSASLLKGFRENVDVVECFVTSLDDFIFEKMICAVDLVKIDTEATEHQVLNGMRKILKNFQPNIICEILFNRNEKEIETILKEYGYHFYWIKTHLVPMKNIVGDPSYRFKNYLFTRLDKSTLGKYFILDGE